MKLPEFPKIDFSKLDYISKKLTSPSAYSAYAVVGVVATMALTIVATRKECKKEFEKNSQGDIFEKEITREEAIQEVKETLINYGPAIASAITTIFCIRKSNQKWMAYNNLINASYIAARDKMARYRALAAPAVGAEVIQGLHGRRSDEGVEWFCIKDCPVDPAFVPDAYFDNIKMDSLNTCVRYNGGTADIYFQSTKADVIEAEYHLNRNFQLRGSASMREFFAFLGILDKFPEAFEDYLGWDAGIMIEDWGIEPWIDFDHWHTTDESTGEVINVINYTWEPCFTEDRNILAWGYGATPDYYEPGHGGRPVTLSPCE